MKHYFDNAAVELLVAKYQLYSPKSREAREISGKIMIEANKIIKRVIILFKLDEYSTFDETFSHGQEKVLMCLKNFRPHHGSLFNYITSTIRRGCKNENIRAYIKKQNSIKTCQLHDNISKDVYINSLDGAFLWNEYKNSFNERPYLLPIFKEMCAIIDEDPTHRSDWYIIGTLTSRIGQFKNAHRGPMKDRREIWKYMGWIKEVINNDSKILYS